MRFLAALLALALALPACATAAPPAGRAPARELRIDVLDVGQGDAILLSSPSGRHVLVDGGPPEAGPVLVRALQRRGIVKLDLLVITHPHLDHVGGLLDVIRAAPPDAVLDPGIDHPLQVYEAILDELGRRKIPMRIARRGQSIDLGGGAVAEVLSPPAEPLRGTRSDVNANSIVLRVRYGDTAILLTGDAEPETERFLTRLGGLRANVLKVAHHGGGYSTTRELLRAVGPEAAVISVGGGNDYGHPAGVTLERLEGANVWRTDRHGTVRIRSDGLKAHVAPLGPEPRLETKFVASRRSEVFHRAGCPTVKKIAPHNLLEHESEAEALAAGRRPAKDCKR